MANRTVQTVTGNAGLRAGPEAELLTPSVKLDLRRLTPPRPAGRRRSMEAGVDDGGSDGAGNAGLRAGLEAALHTPGVKQNPGEAGTPKPHKTTERLGTLAPLPASGGWRRHGRRTVSGPREAGGTSAVHGCRRGRQRSEKGPLYGA